jgi:hypothetical protein
LSSVAVSLAFLATCSGNLHAGVITIPNGSFELPPTTFVATNIDYWQQTPGADTGLTGVFVNTAPGDTNHIDNCDGNQAAWVWAYPGVALAQDYDSTDWANPIPTHAFNATFEVNKAYTLTVGVIGNTNVLRLGATLELSLYYRNPASQMVTVAATTVTNSGQLFPTHTHLVDFSVQVPGVLPTDPCVGQHIGVQIASTVAPELANGYWDVDNVRLVETPLPALLNPQMINNQFSFTLQSFPDQRFEILAHTNLSAPLSDWKSIGTVTNTTGITNFTDPAANLTRRFYRANQLQ